jgi:hypothetical protein
MRLGGTFNFGQPALAVQIPQGAAWYPPAGNYLTTLGGQTVIQYWDSVQFTWRNLGAPLASDPCWFSCDGTNMRMVNSSGIVQGVQITNAGSGAAANGIGSAATGVTVAIAAPATGVAATAYPIVGGALSTIAVTQAGSGFVVPPIILIDPPPPGGIQAVATATITAAGALNAVTVVNPGAGYTSVPNAYVMPQYLTNPGMGPPVNAVAPTSVIPPGALASPQPPWLPNFNWPLNVPLSGGALLTVGALTGSLTLTGVVMIQNGNGYLGTAIPAVSFVGIAGGVAATSIMALACQSLTITSAGVAYPTGTSQIVISDLGELVSGASVVGTTSFGVQVVNNDTLGPRPLRARAPTGAGTTIVSTVLEDPGFAFQIVPAVGILPVGGAAVTPPTSLAFITPVVGGITDVILVQPSTMP